MKRYYWDNPFVFETEVELSQVDGAQCTINPIIFHPDEGGQPPDSGTIGDAKIVRIEPKDGNALIMLDKELPSGIYIARIDKDNRLAQSRRHTAQHIISGIAEKQMGLLTTGVRIGDTCTIDFDKKIEWVEAEKLERLSNDAVMMDFPIITEYGTIADRGRFNQELSDKENDDLRIVVIADIDKSACCGTHVPTTGMIGSVRICSVESSRQGSRITFKASLDAIEYGQSESAVLRNLRKATSCANDELVGSFAKLQEQQSQLTRENANLWEKLIPIELDNSLTISSALFGNMSILVTSAPPKLLPKIAQMLSLKNNLTSVVLSENMLNATISSPNGIAKEVFTKLSTYYKVKGGGSPASVNLIFESGTVISDLIKHLKE